LREECGVLLTPFYSPSLTELERGNDGKKLSASPLSFSFLLTPFNSPSLNELERGNNSKKSYSYRPSLLKREGKGD
jgi:hypothetical protein